jgi:hypothetical protein
LPTFDLTRPYDVLAQLFQILDEAEVLPELSLSLYSTLHFSHTENPGQMITSGASILSTVDWFSRDWFQTTHFGWEERLLVGHLLSDLARLALEFKAISESYVNFETQSQTTEAENETRAGEAAKTLALWMESRNRLARAVSILRCHITEHLSHYLKIVWSAESPEDRACAIQRLYPEIMPRFWTFVRNELITVIGNCMVMPLEVEARPSAAGSASAKVVAREIEHTVAKGAGILTSETADQGRKIALHPEAEGFLSTVAQLIDTVYAELQKYTPSTREEELRVEELRQAIVELARSVRLTSAGEKSPTLAKLLEAATTHAAAQLTVRKDLLAKYAGLFAASEKTVTRPKSIGGGRVVVNLKYLATRIQDSIDALHERAYAFDKNGYSDYEKHCLRVEANARAYRRETARSVFVQLPTSALCVEPRLTFCAAWSSEMATDWETGHEKAALQNQVLDLKRRRHEERVDAGTLDNPDCCPEASFKIRIDHDESPSG